MLKTQLNLFLFYFQQIKNMNQEMKDEEYNGHDH